jgi:hypothetical protein
MSKIACRIDKIHETLKETLLNKLFTAADILKNVTGTSIVGGGGGG